MSPRKWPRRIEDMLDAMDEIQLFVRGFSYEQFEADAKTIKAVATDLAIIGEAVSHIPEDVMLSCSAIPWEIMKSMRNRIVHVYFDVDPKIIWDTIQQDIPPLVGPLQKLLRENS